MNMLQPMRRFLGLAMFLVLGILLLPSIASGQATITTPPANKTVTAGQTATFTVMATGSGTLSYQWQKNGGNIAGAIASSYTTPPTTTFDVGTPISFTVVVTDASNIPVTSSPAATLTVNSPSGPFVYVTNHSASSVSVIDTSSNLVVATIPLCGDCGSQGPAGLAVTPGGKFVYVANQTSGTVSVIAAATNTVSTTISLPSLGCGGCFRSPVGVAITPDGSRAYVTDVGQLAVHVIGTSTNTVTTTITADIGNPNGPIAITPDGSAAFYTFGTGSVGRIDTNPSDIVPIVPITTYNMHTTTLQVGNSPSGVAVTPNGAFVYVANNGGNTVSVIPNTFPGFGGGGSPTPYPIVSLPEGSGPGSIAITPDGASAYVVNQGNSTVSVITTAGNTLATTISSGFCGSGMLNQIAITSDGTKAYVADQFFDPCQTADVINIPANTVTPTVPVGSSPVGVAASGSQTKTLGGPGTTTTFTFNTDHYKLTGVTNQGGEQVTVDAFLIPASKFPPLTGFSTETCIPYGDYSAGGVDICVEFQVHCQISATNTTPCNFIYLVATGYDLPADLSGGIGGPDFLVAHGVDCELTSASTVQSIFLSYEATIKDPTTRGGSRGPSCFVATYTPGAPPITTGTTSRFKGWESPVSNADLNQVKAGAARPLPFEFFDILGNPVTNLSLCNQFTTNANGVNVCMDSPAVPTPWVNLASFGVPCAIGAQINVSTDGTIALPGNSGLSSNGGGSYQLVWKTRKGWKGFCANVVVTFDSSLIVVPATLGFQFN
jgi:YVTN family beta-propeller protein